MDRPAAGTEAGDRRISSIHEELKKKLDRCLLEEIGLGSFPGAVYAIGDSSGILLEEALGHAVVKPAKVPVSIDTTYDVASLTKPLITSTLVLGTAAEGRIDLQDPVSRVLPEIDTPDKRELTFLDLLTHRAGFQAWYPLYVEGTGPKAYLDALARRPLRYRPGTREIYTCLGFILLYLALGRIHDRSVEDLAREKIFEPLDLHHSLFNPPPSARYTIAATEWGNSHERRMVADRGLTFREFRSTMIWGEVNDGNAWHMGGVAGNAGLFSTARDVFRIAQAYLAYDELLLPRDWIEWSTQNYTLGLEENRGLGWQLPSTRPNKPWSMLSERSFGHTGFTGTSVWADRDRDLVIVLLTNRIHPSVQPLDMQKVRYRFHRLVVDAWG